MRVTNGQRRSRRLRVLVDLDGVLADLERSFDERLGLHFPDQPRVSVAQRTSFRLDRDYPREVVVEVLRQPGFFGDLEPIDGALDGVGEIVERGHEVMICSALFRSSPTCEEEKRSWVGAHLGSALASTCVFASDKTTVPGDILIDDFPRHVGEVRPSWRQVLFDQPYNRHVDADELHCLGASERPVRWDGWERIDVLLAQLDRFDASVEGNRW